MRVGEEIHCLAQDAVVAVNPWAPHNFLPTDVERRGAVLRALCQSRLVRRMRSTGGGCGSGAKPNRAYPAIERHVRRAAGLVCGAPSLSGLDASCASLIAACHEESWLQTTPAAEALAAITDFRVRKSIKLLSEPRARISNSTRSRAERGCRDHISTNCFAHRPA